MMRIIFFWLLPAAVLYGCQAREAPVADITAIPEVSDADKPYAGVFAALDGRWEGKFYVYEDSMGQSQGPAQPKNLSGFYPERMSLKLSQIINVHQEYVSETPYFQRVMIRDTYHDEGGQTKVIESQGVNKIQHGQIWCVVVKPAETVIHSGKMDGEHTFLWQRDERNPLKIEYFRETVTETSYIILGWGYYGNDDPGLAPRWWFYGDYRRVK